MNSNTFGIAGLAALLLVGCAAQGGPEATRTTAAMPASTAEQQVMDRAQARWDAARAGEFEKSFSYTAPSYRAVTDLKIYRNETSGSQSLVSAKVIGVKCENETSCAAKIRLEYYEPFTVNKLKPGIIQNHYDEPWIKEDGAWWLFKR